MADFDVTLGSNKGNVNVEFDKPTSNLTLKNQAPTKTSIRDFNDEDISSLKSSAHKEHARKKRMIESLYFINKI